jgi:hypothetical protein
MAVVLALCVSAAFVPLAANIVLRVPDLYNFDLGRTGVLETSEYVVEKDSVGDLMSRYTRHKTDTFQLEVKVEGRTETLFTPTDSAAMSLVRKHLDVFLKWGIIALIAFFSIYIALARLGRKRELKLGFRAGFILYGASIALLGASVFVDGLGQRAWRGALGIRFEPGDMLPRLFHEGFFLSALAVTAVIALVILLILNSITRVLTRDDRMF